MATTHDYLPDPRNEDILIYVNGELLHRNDAKISVFDSGFLLGDGMWESFRLHKGVLAFAEEHMERLLKNAKALDIKLSMSLAEIEAAIYETVEANHMESDVHIRLIITRGLKTTPYQNPYFSAGGPSLVIIPEYKVLDDKVKEIPINLYTLYNRRGRPDVIDPKLHPLSKLNCVLSCIQALYAGADEGLMLDPQGFVSSCNSTSFFIVKKNEVWTSTGDYCLHGITRENVIRLCRENQIPVYEKNFSLTDVYSADEAFVTGTFAGLIPVGTVDGRVIGHGKRGEMTKRLCEAYWRFFEDACQSR